MLLSSIKSFNHNIFEEALIVFSLSGTSRGYYLNESYNENISFFNVSIISENEKSGEAKFIYLKSEDLIKLNSGDVIIIRPNGSIKLLFKASSNDNALFITEQCNNYCLMCSQPPGRKNDIDYYYNLNSKLLDILPDEIERLGITGGEPTILENKLLQLLRKISSKLLTTEIHMLSNGRKFADFYYAKELSEIGLNKLLIGIPFHSDYYKDHDFIAQSAGSYYETIKGIYNLARFDNDIELRIVINKMNYSRLPQMSDFIYKNMPFVNHIAFMALEYTGLVPKNHDKIWIDPIEYCNELELAVTNLASWNLNVSVFNLPLCLINESIYKYAKKSISDWKVKYLETCEFCSALGDCGGVFATSKRLSPNIKAIT